MFGFLFSNRRTTIITIVVLIIVIGLVIGLSVGLTVGRSSSNGGNYIVANTTQSTIGNTRINPSDNTTTSTISNTISTFPLLHLNNIFNDHSTTK